MMRFLGVFPEQIHTCSDVMCHSGTVFNDQMIKSVISVRDRATKMSKSVV